MENGVVLTSPRNGNHNFRNGALAETAKRKTVCWPKRQNGVLAEMANIIERAQFKNGEPAKRQSGRRKAAEEDGTTMRRPIIYSILYYILLYYIILSYVH